MFRNFLILASVLSLTAAASAQQQIPGSSLQPVSNLQYGAYDFENGFTVTNGTNRATGPDTLFDTTGDAAYYYFALGGDSTKQEFLDEAQLPNRGLKGEEQLTGMAWSYCEAGYTSYFDATVSIYKDTVACAGPSAWVPGAPSFADCVYGINGLPGVGCWTVSVDLSCGYECTVPDASNPASGAQATLGWSVTPTNCNGSPYLGPLLGTQANATPGSQDLFEWRDWNGNYFGSYVHGGCFWFGGGAFVRADFLVAFYGAAVDVQNCYNSRPLDTLCLEALTDPESLPVWSYSVSGLPATPSRVALLVQRDLSGGDPGCDQAPMFGASWTRQVSPAANASLWPGTVSGSFTGSFNFPNLWANNHVILQAVAFPTTGPVNPSTVIAASNGIDTTL